MHSVNSSWGGGHPNQIMHLTLLSLTNVETKTKRNGDVKYGNMPFPPKKNCGYVYNSRTILREENWIFVVKAVLMIKRIFNYFIICMCLVNPYGWFVSLNFRSQMVIPDGFDG